jgi:RNA-directed DNA polymerase
MNFKNYCLVFTKEALEKEFFQQNIQRFLDYASVLFLQQIPFIYNITHLALLVGYQKKCLYKAILYTNSFYRDFEIIKIFPC